MINKQYLVDPGHWLNNPLDTGRHCLALEHLVLLQMLLTVQHNSEFWQI